MNNTTDRHLRKSRRVRLGIPIDLFLDRDYNRLSRHENAVRRNAATYDMPGGLVLPGTATVGTGNVVIRGRPGSGKSILAMQLAQKCCAMNGSQFFSWFIALEERPEYVVQKAASFGWQEDYHCVRNLNELGDLTSPQKYAEILLRILSKSPETCFVHQATEALKKAEGDAVSDIPGHPARGETTDGPIRPQVYVSRLSPRHLSPTGDSEADIFEERAKEIENLLCGAEWLRRHRQDLPQLAMVCIDSLNVFGDRLLTREQLYRLFDMFKRTGIIGVFVLEEDEGQAISPDSRLHGDVIEFLADVVISLQYGEDAGYFVRYFEIVKSRHQHQIYGKHPFKIMRHDGRNAEEQCDAGEHDDPNMPVQHGIVIFPSLHYIVYATEPVTAGERP